MDGTTRQTSESKEEKKSNVPRARCFPHACTYPWNREWWATGPWTSAAPTVASGAARKPEEKERHESRVDWITGLVSANVIGQTLLSNVAPLTRVSSIPTGSCGLILSKSFASSGNRTLLKQASHSTADRVCRSWTSSALCRYVTADILTCRLASQHNFEMPIDGKNYNNWETDGLQDLTKTYPVIVTSANKDKNRAAELFHLLQSSFSNAKFVFTRFIWAPRLWLVIAARDAWISLYLPRSNLLIPNGVWFIQCEVISSASLVSMTREPELLHLLQCYMIVNMEKIQGISL